MTKARLEAFSDGVIAIIITIMVLELKVPHGDTFEDLKPVIPVALSYLLSFVFVGIYWVNHHHMLHVTHRVNGAILWANLHLLFWLSLIPVTTAWFGESHLAPHPVALYGIVLLGSALAYTALQWAIIRQQGPSSKLKEAVGRDVKGSISGALYASAIGLAFALPIASVAIYVLVAAIWLVPDRRIESRFAAE